MEKKKLLIAIHNMNVGGVQKSLLTALRAIDRKKYDITLYVRKNKTALLQSAAPYTDKIIVNDDATRYYRKPKAVFYALMLQLRQRTGGNTGKWKEKLDRFVIEGRMRYEKEQYFPEGTIYDTAISYIQGYTAAFVQACVDAERKIVFYHGSTDENHALHERIFPLFGRIVAVNAGCEKILKTLYPACADQITYIENYVDADEIRAAAQAYEPDRAGRQTVLCTCGRFSPEKGFDLAVEAAAKLKAAGLDFIWYFVGDGPERANLVSAVQAAKLGAQIRFTGTLENPYPYIGGCDIYVQPSYEEAQPLSVKEAALLCRPVVTTATVGGRNIVADGETGLISEIDAADLADKILMLARGDALREHMRLVLSKTDPAAEKAAYENAWAALLA